MNTSSSQYALWPLRSHSSGGGFLCRKGYGRNCQWQLRVGRIALTGAEACAGNAFELLIHRSLPWHPQIFPKSKFEKHGNVDLAIASAHSVLFLERRQVYPFLCLGSPVQSDTFSNAMPDSCWVTHIGPATV